MPRYCQTVAVRLGSKVLQVISGLAEPQISCVFNKSQWAQLSSKLIQSIAGCSQRLQSLLRNSQLLRQR
jgi:hypothetical protein